MSQPRRAAAKVAAQLTKAELTANPNGAGNEDEEGNDSSYESGNDTAKVPLDDTKTRKPTNQRKKKGPEGLYLSDEEEEEASRNATVLPLGSRVSVQRSNLTPATLNATNGSASICKKEEVKRSSIEEVMGLGNSDQWKKRVGSVLSNLNKPRKVSKKPKLDRTVSRILANSGKPTATRAQLQEAAKKALANTGSVKVTKKVAFAGEHIEVTKVVEKSSKDAEIEAAKQMAEKEKSVSALDQLVDGLSKRTGINTVQKSNFDWQKFKADKNIQEELNQKTKDGYVEKQDFLQRVDLRQFEQEKQARAAERAKREANAN